MNILHTEWSDGWGGQERRIITEMCGMLGRGHRVWLLTRTHAQIAQHARLNGIPVYCAPMRGPADLASTIYTRRLLHRLKIDVINTHSGVDTWIGGLASRLGHPVTFIRTRHLDIPLRRRPSNFIHYLPDQIITCGSNTMNHLINNCNFPSRQITNIPTGIDFHHFQPQRDRSEMRRTLNIHDQQPSILMVGVLRGVKRHLLALEALQLLHQHHPDAVLVIAGEGPIRTEIEAQAQQLDLVESIRFLGYRDDIPDLMHAADQLWLTSRSEGVPQVITQALGLGLPVVSTDVGSVRDLITSGKTGLLAPAEDAPAIAEAATQLIGDTELCRRIAINGQALAQSRFSLDGMLDATENIYQLCLERA